ncbi:MAG: M14 family zinc carboxypeptidase [Bacillus sp. (in: firmicutes)]
MKKLAVSVLLFNSLLYPLSAFAETNSSNLQDSHELILQKQEDKQERSSDVMNADEGTENQISDQESEVDQETTEDPAEPVEDDDISEQPLDQEQPLEGWVQEGENWFYYIDGEKATGWNEIEGIWYYFDLGTGARQHGWIEVDEEFFYLDSETGAMQTGWYEEDGKWYYLDEETGAKQFGHVEADGKWYYLDPATGAMKHGWLLLENNWYYFHYKTGERHSGWLQDGTKWYYLLPETGVMQTKWFQADGKWYYSDAKTGQRQTGWLKDGTKWYYLNADGSMKTGWVYYKYKWYYLKDSGAMALGWVKDAGKWYYLDPGSDGAMDTGWLKWNNKWYFLNKDGSMKIGWLNWNGKWYYLYDSGAMATGWYKDGNKWYYSYSSGVMAADTYVDGYYLAKNGAWIPDIVNPRKVYTYDEMVSDIMEFKKHYPDLVTVQTIGKSVDGRNIYAFKLGNGPKEILLNGSHHAREHMTTNLLMEMADQYLQSYEKGTIFADYSVRNILNKTSMWFVPMVNPDGVTLVQKGAYSTKNPSYVLLLNNGSYNFSEWKANVRGVDLNRQYPANWENIRGNTGKPAPSHFKGYKPLSEPEALALYEFTKAHNFKIATAYHSSGEILYWYFKQSGSNYSRDYRIAQKYQRLTGYSLVQPTTNPSGGGFTDWFIQDIKMPGFTPEISPYTYGKPVPVSRFDSIWNENKAAGLMLANEALGL